LHRERDISASCSTAPQFVDEISVLKGHGFTASGKLGCEVGWGFIPGTMSIEQYGALQAAEKLPYATTAEAL
jgi:hypothetical protein